MKTTTVDEALALALRLDPKERLQLIERIASSVGHVDVKLPDEQTRQGKTAAEIAAILEAMEPIEFVDPHIEDPVAWVKAQRRKRADKLKAYRVGG